ncbi:hypothetical protein [Sorangium sp. So ce385]|uniref:hypothetical protein n=1 Tax=Sorangium sp. So ce385 TaxID=3133308 RepID=UPI003F5C84C0
MIELTFKVTPDGDEPRDIFVRIHEPTRSPPEEEWPWSVTVDLDGRPFTTHGMDPLDAVETGARHAAIVLREIHGDALDPPLEPRMKEGE